LEGPYNSGYTYGYNTAGEVVSAAHKNTASRNRAYRYDAIGNREWATEGGTVSPGIPEDPAVNATAVTHYTANNLNQYTSVQSVPSAPTAPIHDLNGNMAADGMGRVFAYDEENRLVAVETDTTRVAYAYDGLSCRVRRTEFTRANPFALWSQTADRHYLYDGWNVIAEYDTGSAGILPALACTHVWGLDLSNIEQGAGGVGGLLATRGFQRRRTYKPWCTVANPMS
jgi:YD repeat-containing protein